MVLIGILAMMIVLAGVNPNTAMVIFDEWEKVYHETS